MKIAFFSDCFYPHLSGVTSAMIAHANLLVEQGHEVVIFNQTPWKYLKTIDALDERVELQSIGLSMRVPGHNKLYLGIPTFYRTWKYLRAHNVDVVHLQTQFGSGLEGMIIAKWLKIPTITTFNTYFSHPDWVKAVGWFLPGWMGNLMWFWDRIFCNLADQAIAPTQIVRDDLLAHGFRKDIHVISYGAAYTNTPPTETTAQLRERFDVVGTKNILFIGRLSFEKNIDQLIDALALLVQKDPSYRLILVGEGPYEQHLREKLKQLNLLSYTTFLGPQDHQTIVEQNLYRLGDVFVTCSKAETLGITVLESMLQKVPVICVPEKGYRDLVEDHKTGFFVEAGSATSLSETLQHLFTHPKDLQKVIQPAYEYALKTHSTEQVVEQFKTLYTATLANKENSAQLKGRQKEANHTGTD